MKKIKATSLFIILCFSVLLVSCKDVDVRVSDLRCEMRTNPLGIDCINPNLSWIIDGDERNIVQTGYRILVASSAEILKQNKGDLWDTEVVSSDNSIYIPYTGKNLDSHMECYWKVKVITNKGESDWSEPAFWTMGLLKESDWKAQWIGLDKTFEDEIIKGRTRLAARYFRKEFNLSKPLEKATLYITGLGFYDAFINNQRIGTQVLSPTPTDYTKTVKYNTFDVTNELTSGNNAIGVAVGNGRYFSMFIPNIRHFGLPKMIAQLEIEYKDGSREIIVSDNSWKVTADGPIRANNEFDGEEYDALKEMPGWSLPAFDDTNWFQAELVDLPGGKLESQINRNITIMEVIHPISINESKPGMYILDMGQNMVGWLQMKVKGTKGQEIQLRFAELLKEDGTLYMDNLRSALVTDKYKMKGDREEVWEPTFTYHGFRYVELTGFSEKPSLSDFEGKVIYDEMETIGTFETSNQTLNQIYKNAYWGIRGNYRGMPTDCPQRDERMGWLGDRAVGSHGESFIFNNHLLYAKWLDDIEEAQLENGAVPDVAPNYWSVYTDNMTWPGAYLIIANMLYEQFGDTKPIFKHYGSMKRWMNYMKERYMADYIMPKDTFGDWCMPPESPELIHSQDSSRITEAAVLGTTFYYRMLELLIRFADLQNLQEDVDYFRSEAEKVKNSFNEKYFNQKTGYYSNNTVTANLLPLSYGMVPEEYKQKVFNHIVDKTMGDFKGHISTGLVGIQWLMRGLTLNGRTDLAYKLATNRDYPSWGYMVENGATTIWELWNGNTADPAMNSANHVMLLGDLIVWFYEYVAGIQNSPSNVAFKEIRMKPYPVEGLDFVNASYRSVRGIIKSSWKKKENRFEWNVSIPANSTAIVYIPSQINGKITESGKDITASDDIKYIKNEEGYTVVQVGSGNFTFISEQ